jgi:hypothetical protein
MSYARFGGDSDVYVFASRDHLECCGCILQQREWVDKPGYSSLTDGYFKAVGNIIPHTFKTNAEMIEHLEKHISVGHQVPEYCLERLRDPEDAKENEEYFRAQEEK